MTYGIEQNEDDHNSIEISEKTSCDPKVVFTVKEGKPESEEESPKKPNIQTRPDKTEITAVTYIPKMSTKRRGSTKIHISPKEEDKSSLLDESMYAGDDYLSIEHDSMFNIPTEDPCVFSTPAIWVQPESRRIYSSEDQNNYPLSDVSVVNTDEKRTKCEEEGVSLVQFVSEISHNAKKENNVFVQPQTESSDTNLVPSSPPLKRRFEVSNVFRCVTTDEVENDGEIENQVHRLSPQLKQDPYPFVDPSSIRTSDINFGKISFFCCITFT